MTSRIRSHSSPNSPAPRRRTVVKAAAAGAVLAAPLAASIPAQAAQAPAFLHGVASGDPLPDGVLLWTRVTPIPEAVPGSGLGPDVEVNWTVARDKAFTNIVAKGSTTATAASDHTVKADIRGLAPPPTTGSASPPAAPTRRPPAPAPARPPTPP